MNMNENFPIRNDRPFQYCPECGPKPGYMKVIMFLGIEPDGYVCKMCKGYFAEVDGDPKKLGVII